MAIHMKGITYCGECADYDQKKHRCKRGFYKENDPLAPFFDNCGLPDVQPVVHGRWEKVGEYPPAWRCSTCFGNFPEYNVKRDWICCPICGTKMDLEDNT